MSIEVIRLAAINRRKQILNMLLGFTVAAGSTYLLFRTMDQAITQHNYVNVVAVKPGHMIEPYMPILASDLTYLPMAKDHVIPGTFTDPAKVVGKRTYQKVGELSPILDWQLTDNKFLPDPAKGELQYEFPVNDFAPLTVIRTGDVVGIWVKYRDDSEEVITPEGVTIKKEPTLFKKTNPGADLLFTTVAAGIKDGEGAEVFSLKPPKLSSQVIGQAIENIDTGSDTQDRLAASYRGKPTKAPAKVLLNLTPQQVKVLQEAKQYGDWLMGVGYFTPDQIVKGGGNP